MIYEFRKRLSAIHAQMNVENITYESFDEMAFLALLSTKTERGTQREVLLQRDTIDTVPQPWRRYFARMFDVGIYQIIWLATRLFIFRSSINSAGFETMIHSFIAMSLALLVEPYLLTFFGTTPGKWIMGLQVRSNLGKPSLNQARKRTWNLFAYGLGYNIPIYSDFVMYRNYGECSNNKMLAWDEETLVVLLDTKKWRSFAMFGMMIGQLVIVIWQIIQSYLPMYRGNLTPAQYFANVNDAMKQENYQFGMKLSNKGEWIDDPDDEIITVFRSSLPKHELILKDGIVVGVQLETISTEKFVYIDYDQRLFAFRAFAGANKSIKANDLVFDPVLKLLANQESFSAEFDNMIIENKAEIVGYDRSDSYLIAKQDAEDLYYRSLFVIRFSNR